MPAATLGTVPDRLLDAVDVDARTVLAPRDRDEDTAGLDGADLPGVAADAAAELTQ
jgi:hypothetical protein